MIFARLAKDAGKFLTENSPAVLTAVGVAGTVATAVLTGQAASKAALIIDKEQQKQNLNRAAGEVKEVLDRKAKIRLVWKLYVPAASTGALTITAIIAANRIGMRRAAAVAAAYSLSEKRIIELKDKVAEKFGDKKVEEIRDEMAQDRVNKQYTKEASHIVIGEGKVLCMDAYSGRFFDSTVETIRKAENDINRQIQRQDYATVSDFYDKIKLPHTAVSDEFGWNTSTPLSLAWSTTKTPDEKPAMVFEFEEMPILRPWTADSFR